jgi:CubicO group peptidase (beta-lactamase class C family)
MIAATPVAVRSEVKLPDTPAGRFVSAFLAAFNSADPKALERYNALYGRKTPPQDWIDMHASTGRLTPVLIEASAPNEITLLLADEHGDGLLREKVVIDPADPMKVLHATLSPADRPAELAIPRMPRAELNRAMTARLAREVSADRFAGTVMVVRHGRLIYRRASGLADRGAKVPVTMKTKFRVGSTNKMFTAVGVLQLVEKGRIALDAPVGAYLKDYPNAEFAKSVTVRQLLSHTGGAGDIFTPEYEARRLETRLPTDYVRLFGARAPDTSEEGRNAYANYGFVLLGRIIEVVSGEDYYAYVQRHIFQPAKMTETASLPENVPVRDRSRGYMRAAG